MSAPRFHPAASLVVWLFFIVALAMLPLPALLCLMLAAAAWPRLLWQAVQRMRWLLLATALLAGWYVPGLPLWPAQAWSPSWQGLQLGAAQALRLLLMALSLRLLWRHYGSGAMLAAVLHLLHLLQPWRAAGLPVQRVAVRLVLTLQYAEALLATQPKPSLAWLQQQLLAQQGSQTQPDQVELGFYPWHSRDSWLLLVAALVLAIIMKAVQ